MNYHGKTTSIGILSNAQTLPDGTIDSTNMVYIGGSTPGNLVLAVYANNAVEIATGQAFNIELEVYTADTAASAASLIDNAHVYLLHKTSSDNELAFDAGDLILEYVIPPSMFGSNTYVQLKYVTDTDESADKVDAFVYVQV